jgi:hypothetical protein
MNPYVFFVGCPRSGTTLLRRIGNAHPELAIIGELHWLPRWWEQRAGISPEGMVTQELVDRLLADPRFPRFRLAGERVAELLENGRPKHFARFVTELFDLHGQVNGKRLVGEKTPGYVHHLPTLHSLWPQAKIVHLIRDGRDVALSILDWRKGERIVGRVPTWEEDRISTTALWWEWNVRLGREAAGFLGPDRYYELRYESLVTDPEAECEKLCAFLGLAYDAGMLSFHEGRLKSKPGLSAKAAWLPVTRGLRSWEEQMSSDDMARFEAAAGDLLGELGYRRSTVSLSPDMLEHAASLRAAQSDHVRARQRPVPAAWTVPR